MATGLSIEWSNFFSTEWSIPMSVISGLSIDWSKNLFFHQSIIMVNVTFCLCSQLTTLKIFFLASQFVFCCLGRFLFRFLGVRLVVLVLVFVCLWRLVGVGGLVG